MCGHLCGLMGWSHGMHGRCDMPRSTGDGVYGDKIFTMDDFVIPRQPSVARFSMETQPTTGGALVDFHCRNVSCVETLETRDCEQEVAMFAAFAAAMTQSRASGAIADPSWGRYSLATQIVLDACLASMRADGQAVTIDERM
jgi:hypothetical protein